MGKISNMLLIMISQARSKIMSIGWAVLAVQGQQGLHTHSSLPTSSAMQKISSASSKRQTSQFRRSLKSLLTTTMIMVVRTEGATDRTFVWWPSDDWGHYFDNAWDNMAQ